MSTLSNGDSVSVVRRITCVGAGSVGGLTCAMIASKCPHITVTVVDMNTDKIAEWHSDNLPIYEPGLEEIVRRCRGANLFFSSDVPKSIRDADLVFVSPMFLPAVKGTSKSPELKCIEAAAKLIALHAEGPKIIVEKSTVPLKAAESILSILRDAQKSNKRLKFQILSNPQLIGDGRGLNDLANPDRVLIRGEDSYEGKKAVAALVEVYSSWVAKDKIITTNSWRSNENNRRFSRICTSCDNESSTHVCENCDDALCPTCVNAHQILRITRNHSLIPLEYDSKDSNIQMNNESIDDEWQKRTFEWMTEESPHICNWCGVSVVGNPRRGLCHTCFRNSPNSQYIEFLEGINKSNDSISVLAHLPMKIQEVLSCGICYSTLDDPVKMPCCHQRMCRRCSMKLTIAHKGVLLNEDVSEEDDDDFGGLIERVRPSNATMRRIPLTGCNDNNQLSCPFCRGHYDINDELESDHSTKDIVSQLSEIKLTEEDLAPLIAALRIECNDKAAKIAKGRAYAICLDSLRTIFKGKKELNVHVKLSEEEQQKRLIEYEWIEGEKRIIREGVEEKMREERKIQSIKGSMSPLQILSQEMHADLNFWSTERRRARGDILPLWESSIVIENKLYFGRSFTLKRAKQVCAMRVVNECFPGRPHSFLWLDGEEIENQ